MEDPFGKGWLVKCASIPAASPELLTADQYREAIGEKR